MANDDEILEDDLDLDAEAVEDGPEDVLDEDLDDDLDAGDLDEDPETFSPAAEDDDVVEELEEEDADEQPVPHTTRRAEGEDDDEDEEDVDPDDVEADLDTILKDRLAAQVTEEDDDEEAAEPEERSDGPTKILPRRPGEFVCQSCFLVKHPSQLADADAMLCTDCV